MSVNTPVDPSQFDLEAIDLSDRDFWAEPPAVRHAVFDKLRTERPFAFFDEPTMEGMEPGPGYWAVTRLADLDAISSQPAVFCSGQGAVSIQDMPADLSEFYGSMISMDDPRHARIRRIVAKTFTPRMLEQVVDSVRRHRGRRAGRGARPRPRPATGPSTSSPTSPPPSRCGSSAT